MISIVIPARNEDKNLTSLVGTVLIALSRCKEQGEILLVSSPSWDSTEGVCSRLADDNPYIRHYHTSTTVGKFQALQLGVAHARADWLLLLDADVAVSVEALCILISTRPSHPSVVQPCTWPALPPQMSLSCLSSRTRWLWDWAVLAAYAWDRLRDQYPQHRWALSGYGYLIHRTLIPLTTTVPLVDDAAIGLNVSQCNASIFYCRQACIYYVPPLRWADYVRQKARTRTGWAQLKSRHPGEVRELRHRLRTLLKRQGDSDWRTLLLRLTLSTTDLLLLMVGALLYRCGIGRDGRWHSIASTKQSLSGTAFPTAPPHIENMNVE
jgi:cellulose synthase/poly-beta-1,6-N-acetylglucosamine synthase-like glycosyltransferase